MAESKIIEQIVEKKVQEIAADIVVGLVEDSLQELQPYFKGDKGENGAGAKTPRRGIDYFTENDVSAMIDRVLSLIPKPTDGRSPLSVGKRPPENPQKGDLWYQD